MVDGIIHLRTVANKAKYDSQPGQQRKQNLRSFMLSRLKSFSSFPQRKKKIVTPKELQRLRLMLQIARLRKEQLKNDKIKFGVMAMKQRAAQVKQLRTQALLQPARINQTQLREEPNDFNYAHTSPDCWVGSEDNLGNEVEGDVQSVFNRDIGTFENEYMFGSEDYYGGENYYPEDYYGGEFREPADVMLRKAGLNIDSSTFPLLW